MFKKICSTTILMLVALSGGVASAIDYDFQDIGTLQTHSSEAIALNNQGQILGWYNIDGTKKGQHFFVRDHDGSFHEIYEDESKIYENIPNEKKTVRINWKYLTDDGHVYGTISFNPSSPILYMWDKHNGMVKLGNLPGKEIVAINNAGQVLIKSIVDDENGKTKIRPAIWQNGRITKLKGLSGDLGIEGEESYGFDMNNNGDVIGQSVVYLSYKNNIYKQIHATMWIDGQAIDLHDKMTKRFETLATAITDSREVLIEGMILSQDGSLINIGYGAHCNKMTSKYICYKNHGVFDVVQRSMYSPGNISNKMAESMNSIWMDCIEITSVNDKGEAIAQGKTIYGEKHAILLIPVKTN
ncbi:MAG: hypothetical protein LLG04_13755 [Parachlamydia sp.]|nr:hypothetical protein [Parachlamydia sp.]